MPAAVPKRNPEATRRRILDAAQKLLAEGDGSFEMSWVAKAAGVSQGLAYHHFGSKEGLLTAVVNNFYDRVEDSVLMARLGEIDNWEERERERVRRYIEFLLSDPLGVTVISRLARTPAVAGVEAERWDRLIAEGSRNIAEGQSRGAVRDDADSTLLAAMALGAVRSAVAQVFLSKQSGDAGQLADEIWGFIRRGFGLQDNS